MHKPDPKLAPDKQDKRSVIPLEAGDFDKWLQVTVDQARALMKLTPVEVFDACTALKHAWLPNTATGPTTRP